MYQNNSPVVPKPVAFTVMGLYEPVCLVVDVVTNGFSDAFQPVFVEPSMPEPRSVEPNTNGCPGIVGLTEEVPAENVKPLLLLVGANDTDFVTDTPGDINDED